MAWGKGNKGEKGASEKGATNAQGKAAGARGNAATPKDDGKGAKDGAAQVASNAAGAAPVGQARA